MGFGIAVTRASVAAASIVACSRGPAPRDGVVAGTTFHLPGNGAVLTREAVTRLVGQVTEL